MALPYPTIDWTLDDGLQSIPIEQRDAAEVQRLPGAGAQPLYPEGAAVANYGFDVTPARLITGLITERGLTRATREGLLSLYPEKSDTSS